MMPDSLRCSKTILLANTFDWWHPARPLPGTPFDATAGQQGMMWPAPPLFRSGGMGEGKVQAN
ncbi:hypothetical protein D3867_17460 (plasmid) [Azospirillum argentinense]|uniref:Uncharacterized protein n=1 Tax=Azospirillum brasilense TaxID=192 RepID=A0A4D8Q7N0_AZOBR|nr:hypothetical protein D3867_17460 [Azospirillum argentinense]